MGATFPAPGGGGWLPGEAFTALIYEPIITPVLVLLGIVVFRQILRGLNRG